MDNNDNKIWMSFDEAKAWEKLKEEVNKITWDGHINQQATMFGNKEIKDMYDEQVKEETLRKYLISENKNNGENYKIPKSTIKKDRPQIGSYKFKQNKRK